VSFTWQLEAQIEGEEIKQPREHDFYRLIVFLQCHMFPFPHLHSGLDVMLHMKVQHFVMNQSHS
jgi:hypothetical protein